MRAESVEVTLRDGEPVIILDGAHRFQVTAKVAAELAVKLANVLEFPWTNREPIALPCPRHSTLLIGCGTTCTECYREWLSPAEGSA
jgi:hypothetical protein